MRKLRRHLPLRWPKPGNPLQLVEGDASHWRDEQLIQYVLVSPPAHRMDRALFVIEFKARWTDAHEGEKALVKTLK
jgi:hypothetical protein